MATTENSGGGGGGGGGGSDTAGGSAQRSASGVEAYIGSLISLTSKSEIRYEGVFYNINPGEASIGLKNVRSFGTEGRKKEGPQIPPSDKVYEYILFRGCDIKDLEVKSSQPRVQPAPTQSINNDPAIIQSHYPRPLSTATSMPSAVGGPLLDIGSHNTQIGLAGPNLPGGMPIYQPGGSLGTWGAAPPPHTANHSGLAVPMYWQFYGHPQLPQHSLLRPPPGISMPSSVQQPMQYPNFNGQLPTGVSNLSGANLPPSNLPVSNLPTSLPDIPSLVPASTSSISSSSTSSAPSTLPSTLPPAPSVTPGAESVSSLIPNKALNSVPPAGNLSGSLPSLASLTTPRLEYTPIAPPLNLEFNAIIPPPSNMSSALSGPTSSYQSTGPTLSYQSTGPMPLYQSTGPMPSYQSTSQTTTSIVPSISLQMETPTPSLVTPGQLLQSVPTSVPSSQLAQTAHKDVEVVQVSSSSVSSSEPTVPVRAESQPPILPLPVPTDTSYKPNGFHYHRDYRGRGRGRGTGSSRPVTKFTEDFDFMAMNEKFNKDEVWGHLGKSHKSLSKDKDRKISDEDDSQDADDGESAKIDTKPVYNKDDFFDTLSSNAFDHESQNRRTRFSEQMKIDTETFGDFTRYRGGRGGRGPPRGGRSRGSYHGRGYGYGSRGRGRAMPNHF